MKTFEELKAEIEIDGNWRDEEDDDEEESDDEYIAEGIGINLSVIYLTMSKKLDKIKDPDLRNGFKVLSQLVLMSQYVNAKDVRRLIRRK
jgi:hypothetical protein